ncbi:hypothetical protein M1B34_09890 [Pseudomonas sp. MAFF 302030]|jgi:hypothetical protein|uniref:Uncharacterized protein n=2 Tax=Pseudomonas morbosilactucae TaxID=2938197 RepID=A0A9X1YU05_9PSED|nr:hypothetical protein [Pseudomonas morbosilactucae]
MSVPGVAIRRVSLGNNGELVMLLEPCLARKRFLGSRKLHVVLATFLLGLRFENAERGKIRYSNISKTINALVTDCLFTGQRLGHADVKLGVHLRWAIASRNRRQANHHRLVGSSVNEPKSTNRKMLNFLGGVNTSDT